MDFRDLRKAGGGRVGYAPRKQDLSAPGRKALGSTQRVAGQQTLEEWDTRMHVGHQMQQSSCSRANLANRIKGAKRLSASESRQTQKPGS